MVAMSKRAWSRCQVRVWSRRAAHRNGRFSVTSFGMRARKLHPPIQIFSVRKHVFAERCDVLLDISEAQAARQHGIPHSIY